MIEKNTVFILGAGASAGEPLNYPIGSDLRDKICDNLIKPNSKTKEIAAALAVEADDIPHIEKTVLEFRERFYKSSETTIDLFIQNNYESFDGIAKLAIAQVLIDCENDEVLHCTPQINWYMQLYKLMKVVPPVNFNRNNVSFITFNYDLSLDNFLHNSISNSSKSLHPEMVLKIMKSIPIIHLYGQLGNLSWQEGDADRIYGRKKVSKYQFKSMSRSIKTISDSFDYERDPKFRRIVGLVREAENIFFIGFGFDKPNLDNLPVKLMKGKRIGGTCFGLSKSAHDFARKYFIETSKTAIDLVNLSALDFICKTNIN